MCTVSVVSIQNTIVITSNRDEKVIRPSAIEPKSYWVNNKKIYFPKDPKAGGTWYAVSEDATVVVLLNGADEKHQCKPSYRRSRGLVVLDIASANSAISEWNAIDLQGIEPFTLVVIQNHSLYQLRWNEAEKSTKKLDLKLPHIWSSATLYSKAIREEREVWFLEFLKSNAEISAEKLLHFHRYGKEQNFQNGLVINRKEEMKTLSITQALLQDKEVLLSYHDLQAATESAQFIKTN